MAVWQPEDEDEGRRALERLCRETGPAREQVWWQLLTRLSPHLEQWARENALLRRCGLDTEDDARTVLVGVLERLRRGDFENPRRFLAHQPPEGEDDPDGMVDELARVLRLTGSDEAPERNTPLEGWLRTLIGFVAKDHVRRRLGAGTYASAQGKRALGTGAERLEELPEEGARPPLTDLLAMRQVVSELRAYIGTLPPEMQQALQLWLEDAGLQEIASRLGLVGPLAARKLVRAAQARLRERFRGRWPTLFDV